MFPNNYKQLYQLLGLFITISIALPCFVCSTQVDPQYANCLQPFKCGNSATVLGALKYPYWGVNRESYCGRPGYEIKCVNNIPLLTISATILRVVGTNPEAHKITVAAAIFWNNLCPSLVFRNTSVSNSIYGIDSISPYLGTNQITLVTILYGCPSNLSHPLSWSGQDSCTVNNSNIDVHFVTHTPDVSLTLECVGVATLPMLPESARALDANTTTLPQAINKGFDLGFDSSSANISRCNICLDSGGQCGYTNLTDNGFTCYCADKPYLLECASKQGSKSNSTTKSAIAGGIGISALAMLILISICILRKCKRLTLPSGLAYSKPVPKNKTVEDLLWNYESSALRRYTYSNVAKITSSFREKIGEGGYGTVFKGKLQDGRIVAVKVLKETKGNGQEFANEVVSICSTSHVNVVPLLGFCFEGRRGALIYEFMPNGSLEKFIRKKDVNMEDQTLSSNKLFEIAVGIARGLEYLHQDCNKRIVHFDIKPHNILLDADFTPKISDFGLAKPFKQNGSIVSISGARGTAGYIAPEVFFSSYGKASHKSDVYSYGMMVLEMVGCTKRMEEFESVENSSEMYFPQWIYKQLEQETRVDGEDYKMERKMVLVGLWCIQTNPGSRPSMRGVVGMLEGEFELVVPPMPCLASPPTQYFPTNDGSVNIFSSVTHDSSIDLLISAS